MEFSNSRIRNGAFDTRPGGAIGVFDSGIGGLTVVKELLYLLPHESLVYLGDTARVPYGNKSRQTVLKFSTENVLFLLHHDVKLVVIACHTSSCFALPFLERHFKHPILGVIEPGVEEALRITRSGKVGVIGTNATVGSQAYVTAFAKRDPKVKVTQMACPLFVPLAEEGWINDSVADQVARRYLAPLKAARIDALILGCTHYPLLKRVIARVMGSKVTLIDSAHIVALKTREVLRQSGLLHPASRNNASRCAEARGGASFSASRRFFVTDEPKHFEELSIRFLGRRIGDVQKI